MQRFSGSRSGLFLSLAVAFSFSPVSAQQSHTTINYVAPSPPVAPPATCYAKPADEPELLGVGLFWWDAPECGDARKRWQQAHTRAVVAMEAPPSAASVALLSSAPSSPTLEVDKRGLAFVTDGLAQPPRNLQFVWLPKGTLFPVHTMQSYSTYEERRHDKLRFELDQDVVVNGFLVAMKGDTAEGSFPEVLAGRGIFLIHSGSLFQISIDTIYNFCGDKIDVDFDRTEYRSARLGLMDADVDQHIIRGQQYVSFAPRPQRVCGVPTLKTKSAIPARALYPTTH